MRLSGDELATEVRRLVDCAVKGDNPEVVTNAILSVTQGGWTQIECERVLYVDRGRQTILCDRLPAPVTLVVKNARRSPSDEQVGDMLRNEGDQGVSAAIEDIRAERQRQISEEGWTPQHDDEHGNGQLARAAACYAVGTRIGQSTGCIDKQHRPISRDLWPWEPKWWKPKDPRANLVRAGALIVAEIERLDRVPTPVQDTSTPGGEGA